MDRRSFIAGLLGSAAVAPMTITTTGFPVITEEVLTEGLYGTASRRGPSLWYLNRDFGKMARAPEGARADFITNHSNDDGFFTTEPIRYRVVDVPRRIFWHGDTEIKTIQWSDISWDYSWLPSSPEAGSATI